jgi:hypothetical protein
LTVRALRWPGRWVAASIPQETIRSGWMRISASGASIASARPRTSIPRGLKGSVLATVVDDDRGASGPLGVAELLRALEGMSPDVDRVVLGVVRPHADWNDVRRAVLADSRDPSETALAGQVAELFIV